MSNRPNISFLTTGLFGFRLSKLSPFQKIKKRPNISLDSGICSAPFGSTNSPFAIRFHYLCVFHQIGERLKVVDFHHLWHLKCNSKCKFDTLRLFIHKPPSAFKDNPLAALLAYNDFLARSNHSFNGFYNFSRHQMTALMSFISPLNIILGVSVLAGL